MDFVRSATRVWIRASYILVTRVWRTVGVRKKSETTLHVNLSVDRDDVKISNS